MSTEQYAAILRTLRQLIEAGIVRAGDDAQQQVYLDALEHGANALAALAALQKAEGDK